MVMAVRAMTLDEQIRKQQIEIDASGQDHDHIDTQSAKLTAMPSDQRPGKPACALAQANTILDKVTTVAGLCLFVAGGLIYALAPAAIFALAGTGACSKALDTDDDSSHVYHAASAICFLASYAGVMVFVKIIQYVGKHKI